MSPDDWAVLADRLLVLGHPRAEALALGLSRDGRQIAGLTALVDLAGVLTASAWPWTLLCPPLDRAMTLELYALLRPKMEREARRVLPVGGSLAQMSRSLRRRPRRPPRMRRLAPRGDRADRLTTLARLLDPLLPERWRWSSLAQLIAGDPPLIGQVGHCLRRWAELEAIVDEISGDSSRA